MAYCVHLKRIFNQILLHYYPRRISNEEQLYIQTGMTKNTINEIYHSVTFNGFTYANFLSIPLQELDYLQITQYLQLYASFQY